MPFYLRSPNVTVVQEGEVVSNNAGFNEAYKDTPNVVIDALRITAPSIRPEDVSIDGAGRVIIRNEEFFEAVTAPDIKGGPFVKNAGCGGGC